MQSKIAKENLQERRWLWLSMFGSFTMSVVGLLFAGIAQSNAVLLDAIYSVISFVMAFVASRIAYVVTLPGTTTFHFGYSAFEPFVNALRGLIVLVVLIYAFVGAFTALFAGGREISTGIALGYAITAGTLCIGISKLQRRASLRLNSSFLKIDSDTWFADGMISLCVGAAFLVGFILEWLRWTAYIHYVDPIIVMGMVLYIGRDPVATIVHNLGELLQVAPAQDVQELVAKLVDDGIADLGCAKRDIRMLKIGQFFYVKVACHLLDDGRMFSLKELASIRNNLEAKVRSEYPSARIDLTFGPLPD